MKKFVALIAVMALLSFMLFVGCTDNGNTGGDIITDDVPVIAVSIAPQAAFVEAVCGDLVRVVTMIPAGNSPSNYEPTPALIEDFAQADIYFSIGVPTEANNILPYTEDTTIVADMAKEVASYHEEVLLDGTPDPHIWLSPARVITMTDMICKEISALDPANADIYAANAASFKEQLAQLDTDIKTALADVQNRKFIVFHPAFGYLAADYDLTMYALEEHGKEATAGHMQDMIDMAKAENIKVIFYQAEIDSSQSKAFAEELGGETIMLDPLSADYIENMKLMAKTMAEVME